MGVRENQTAGSIFVLNTVVAVTGFIHEQLFELGQSLVLDLAVELPVYQRDVLYAYNSKVINSNTISSEINPYSSPLDRIWELEFAN